MVIWSTKGLRSLELDVSLETCIEQTSSIRSFLFTQQQTVLSRFQMRKFYPVEVKCVPLLKPCYL